MTERFEPNILCFCCQWCSYAAADLAGSMRMQYPTNVRILKVPCTGRVDITHILQAFEVGADGVFMSGCLLGDCHYVEGNYFATTRAKRAKKILQSIGIDPARVEMFYNSSGMGPQFAQCCTDFTARIRELGPLRKKPAKAQTAAQPAQVQI